MAVVFENAYTFLMFSIKYLFVLQSQKHRSILVAPFD